MLVEPRWCLRASAKNFDSEFEALVHADRGNGTDVSAVVSSIIKSVRATGDKALAELTHKYDGVDLTKTAARVNRDERDKLAQKAPSEQIEALKLAADRIRDFHQRQKPTNLSYTDDLGVKLGYRWTPVDRAGLYVPGGRAAYPSSLLMAAIPARVAGVESLTMTVPTPNGEISPLVMAAAQIVDIEEIYKVGGAQAIAAMAYGTESISPVDVIVGPGNAFVAEAKRQLFGKVGIDMVAGPSEILVISDQHQNPNWIASDLLSQCEHDPSAQAILISPDSSLLKAVKKAISDQLVTLTTQETAKKSWQSHGALIEARDLNHAAELSNRLAPEHLELAVQEPEGLFEKIRHAGSVFLGAYTPEPLGDYLAGPNHILPTERTARFASGLGVHTFMKRTTFLGANSVSFSALSDGTRTLAQAEGLPAHAASIAYRSNR